jgi:hypothetical protein
MDDNKNVEMVTVDDRKDASSEEGHTTEVTERMSGSNGSKNILEVSSSDLLLLSL